ncbi:MAG: ribosome maturation factor RimP [Synergistaceae bacterium]|nr:ribosome maturation factor RimP [Synergistaceae bacterium]
MTEEFLKKIESIVTRSGYECVHVGIRTDFGRMKIQILIDTLGGINVDDCENVSRKINKFLDENSQLPELDKGRYYLEVSSPGVERPLYTLDDYIRFQGREARIRLNGLIDGRKNFTGVISSVNDDNVILICDEIEKHIPFEIIKGGNLIYRFNQENENENDSTEKSRSRRRRNRKK